MNSCTGLPTNTQPSRGSLNKCMSTYIITRERRRPTYTGRQTKTGRDEKGGWLLLSVGVEKEADGNKMNHSVFCCNRLLPESACLWWRSHFNLFVFRGSIVSSSTEEAWLPHCMPTPIQCCAGRAYKDPDTLIIGRLKTRILFMLCSRKHEPFARMR